MALYGNMIGGTAPLKTLQLVDESGAEIVGVVTGSEVVFTATDNDVREGMTYASNYGVRTGTKDIPSYHTTEGYKLIESGEIFKITNLSADDKYAFTKLQVIICPYTGNVDDSVAAEKIAINEGVHNVNSTEVISTVTKDVEDRSINLNISNETDSTYLLRYITYKEII